MFNKLSEFTKAILSGTSAGVTSLIVATSDHTGVTMNEWLITAAAFLAGAGIVAIAPNKPQE